MPNEKILNGTKKQTIIPKTKSLPNGHPTIGSRSGTFCKDEPTVLHSKDIISWFYGSWNGKNKENNKIDHLYK